MSFIILDRDGVINYDSDEYIKSPDEWKPIPGSLEAMSKLTQHGFRILIATNQSGVGRGYYNLDMLNAIHQKMTTLLFELGGKVEEIFVCPHHPNDDCVCRKPKPGLIYQMQKKYHIDLSQTYFIGDTVNDIEAARAAGCLPILVKTGKGQETLEHYQSEDLPHFADLAHAVNYVLSK
jgi:D-glycero-D-manno-heptose 1,7-bisphosphate phosphatase